MAENIIDGLFGVSPYQAQQQQRAATDAMALQYAQLDPFQRASMGMYQSGAQLGNIAGGMLGMENPAVAEAKAREAAISGLDTSSPKAIMERAQQTADPRLKMRLVQYAQQLEAKQQEAKLDQQKAALDVRKQDFAEKQALLPDPEKNPTSYREWELAGKPGRYDDWLLRNKKASGTNITNTIGAEKPIDIPKFRDQVQQTIKPYLITVDAADSSEEMIDQAIRTGNPNSFQGARVQLAKAFGDSQITANEIRAAGGDPSLWGGLKDSTSVLFTGTPSVETMVSVKKTLQALRKVAKKKGSDELSVQKRMGIKAGLNQNDVEEFLSFEQFNEKTKATGTKEITLSNGKKVTVTVSP